MNGELSIYLSIYPSIHLSIRSLDPSKITQIQQQPLLHLYRSLRLIFCASMYEVLKFSSAMDQLSSFYQEFGLFFFVQNHYKIFDIVLYVVNPSFILNLSIYICGKKVIRYFIYLCLDLKWFLPLTQLINLGVYTWHNYISYFSIFSWGLYYFKSGLL